ncbi:deoxyuridine 5'-triphosphate nucleotidohydrolase, mitochondrial [Bombus pascuorum]|uniref:deoxyuridine 5'-triphosphate nucleotidohydrolase, mitochondrial n=1 Tax=Bombus pascuorum TaxID=65598 RepID=UPI00213DD117|nr:deoxyuridine 5'-triphosphate nucleotidohydrolase, mitochondrial [Bombus pascuorum]
MEGNKESVKEENKEPVKEEIKEPLKEENKMLKFVKLSKNAYAPVKGSEYAAGYDLRSAYDYLLPAHGKVLVKTDLKIKLPDNTYGRIAPRSGLSWKYHLDIGAGVIDPDYRGNVLVMLFNHSDVDFKIAPGDRVAQLICEKLIFPKVVEVKELDETERGEDGFGSSGY